MRNNIKRAVAVCLLALTLVSVLFVTSCGITSTVEDFLTADTYTYESEDVKIMVERATVYRKDTNKESYLYYSKEDGRYFYCEIKDGKIKKKSIDSEMYIVQREQMVKEASAVSETLTAFLQLEEAVAESEGKFILGDVAVYESGDAVCVEKQGKLIKIYGVDDTRVAIPNDVKAQIASMF